MPLLVWVHKADPKVVFLKKVQVVAKKVKQVLALGISPNLVVIPLRDSYSLSESLSVRCSWCATVAHLLRKPEKEERM